MDWKNNNHLCVVVRGSFSFFFLSWRMLIKLKKMAFEAIEWLLSFKVRWWLIRRMLLPACSSMENEPRGISPSSDQDFHKSQNFLELVKRVFILWLGFPRVVPIKGLAYKSHSLDSYRGITQPTLTLQNNYTASGTEILHFHVDHIGCWETSDRQFDVSIKHREIVQICNNYCAKYIVNLGE